MSDGDFVRILDEQDLANAKAILLLPQLRTALADLIEWAVRIGGWDAACWRTAEGLLRQLRSVSPHGGPHSLKLTRRPAMARTSDYAVVRLRDGAYRFDRVTDPHSGPVANINRPWTVLATTGWKLLPLLVTQGSKSKVWQTPAEVVASTKLMTPGQARAAVTAADAAGAP